MAQKVDGAYADDHMKFIVLPSSSDSEEDLEAYEASADALLESGTCTEVDVGDAAIAVTGVCYELHFDASADTSTYDIDVTGVDYIVIFTEHDPSEFEADTHYLLTDAGADVEAAHTLPEDDEHAGHDHGDDHGEDEPYEWAGIFDVSADTTVRWVRSFGVLRRRAPYQTSGHHRPNTTTATL